MRLEPCNGFYSKRVGQLEWNVIVYKLAPSRSVSRVLGFSNRGCAQTCFSCRRVLRMLPLLFICVCSVFERRKFPAGIFNGSDIVFSSLVGIWLTDWYVSCKGKCASYQNSDMCSICKSTTLLNFRLFIDWIVSRICQFWNKWRLFDLKSWF